MRLVIGSPVRRRGDGDRRLNDGPRSRRSGKAIVVCDAGGAVADADDADGILRIACVDGAVVEGARAAAHKGCRTGLHTRPAEHQIFAGADAADCHGAALSGAVIGEVILLGPSDLDRLLRDGPCFDGAARRLQLHQREVACGIECGATRPIDIVVVSVPVGGGGGVFQRGDSHSVTARVDSVGIPCRTRRKIVYDDIAVCGKRPVVGPTRHAAVVQSDAQEVAAHLSVDVVSGALRRTAVRRSGDVNVKGDPLCGDHADAGATRLVLDRIGICRFPGDNAVTRAGINVRKGVVLGKITAVVRKGKGDGFCAVRILCDAAARRARAVDGGNRQAFTRNVAAQRAVSGKGGGSVVFSGPSRRRRKGQGRRRDGEACRLIGQRVHSGDVGLTSQNRHFGVISANVLGSRARACRAVLRAGQGTACGVGVVSNYESVSREELVIAVIACAVAFGAFRHGGDGSLRLSVVH